MKIKIKRQDSSYQWIMKRFSLSVTFSEQPILFSIPIFAISVFLYFSVPHGLNKCFCEEYEYESSLMIMMIMTHTGWLFIIVFINLKLNYEDRIEALLLQMNSPYLIHINTGLNSPMMTRACELIAGHMSTCLQIEVNDHSASLGMMSCGQKALN